jgi:pyridoxine 5-phosphate synthase
MHQNVPRLGVNIDHVATLRQARGEYYPRPERAAEVCFSAGADLLTIHLREDRRHIIDQDVITLSKLLKENNWPLNLEIGLADEIIDIAIETAPDWICVVPEKREEKTTEGGLDLKSDSYFEKVKSACHKIKKASPNTNISLFVEADEMTLKRCFECNISAVEIHTGEYAKDFLEGRDINKHLELYKISQKLCLENNIGHHAGHGLTNESVKPLLISGLFEEYNIGHWIIAESVFSGLENVIKEMKVTFEESVL